MISLLDSLSIKKKAQNVQRDSFPDLESAVAYNQNWLPSVFHSMLESTGEIIIYNEANEDLGDGWGKWRPLSQSNSADLLNYYTKQEVEALLNKKVEIEDGKGLSSNDYTTLEKEKLASLENFDDSQIQSHIVTAEGQIADIQTAIGNANLNTTAQTLSEAINEVKNSCDVANTSLGERVTANEDAIAIINGDSSVSGSIKKASSNTLKDAKAYTDQKISEMSDNAAINCDEKPTYFDDGAGNVTITYLKDGESYTTTETSTWFYYTQDDKLMQTIFIVDSTDNSITVQDIVSAGNADFEDFVSKSKDIVSEFDGADTTKIPNVEALQALETHLQTNIDSKISGDAILDSVESSSVTSALSANQGRILNEKINTKLDKTFVGDDIANKHLITDSLGNIGLGSYDEELNLTSSSAPQTKVVKAELDKKFDATQDVANANKVLSVREDGSIGYVDPVELGGTADKVAYENEDYPDLTNVSLALKNILDKINYEPLKITSFTCNVADTHEIGTVLTDIVFSWSYSKDIKTQTLTDCTIVADDRESTVATLQNTKSYVLTASDGSGNEGGVTTATKKISFLYPIYYGCCAEGEYNNDFILALENKKLTASNKMSYNFNCGSGEYAYFATPTNMKVTSAWVNGFQSSVEEVAVVSHTNASGHVSSYTISRFSNSGLGSFVAEVK